MEDAEAELLLQAALEELAAPEGEQQPASERLERAMRAASHLVKLIAGDVEAAHRAVRLLYALQTPEERRRGISIEHNGVGFDAYDAARGSALAQSTFEALADEDLADASRIAQKHATQARTPPPGR